MTGDVELTVRRDDVALAVTDRGGDRPPFLLLHGLASSSLELLPTAGAVADSFHVLIMDQRARLAAARHNPHCDRQRALRLVRA